MLFTTILYTFDIPKILKNFAEAKYSNLGRHLSLYM